MYLQNFLIYIHRLRLAPPATIELLLQQFFLIIKKNLKVIQKFLLFEKILVHLLSKLYVLKSINEICSSLVYIQFLISVFTLITRHIGLQNGIRTRTLIFEVLRLNLLTICKFNKDLLYVSESTMWDSNPPPRFGRPRY